jgi:hypothetical protein
MAVAKRFTLFLDVTQCCLVDVKLLFQGKFCLYL